MLAVDQTSSTDKTQPVVVRSVTLEMTSEEAEVLVKAMAEGRLQLALRNPLDNQKRPPESPPVAKPVPAAEPVKPVVRRSNGGAGVTIIRGTDVNVAKVQL